MPRRFREDCTSDSELADSDEDPFERETSADFDHTTPVSGSDNEEPSPSQYRKEMAEEPCDQSIDQKSDREEDEESDMPEVFDGDALDAMLNAQKRGPEQMVAQFLNVTRQFTATLEDMRKQDLMQSRGNLSRKSLDFDSLQPPSRARPQKFTPPYKGSKLISASPEDFDFDAQSMTSQSSRTARTRLMAQFREIGTRSKSEFTPEQIKKWIEDHAKTEMLKAGDLEDLRRRASDVGGFRQANVRFLAIILFISHFVLFCD